jgi:hypothetical protein
MNNESSSGIPFEIVADLQNQITALQARLATVEQEREKLRKALILISDAELDSSCGCDHTDEHCCVKVNEYCAFCIADLALQPLPSPPVSSGEEA